MNTLKLIGTSHDGKLTVSVPEEYDDKELEIMIISSKEMKEENDQKIKIEQRTDKFEFFVDKV